jgi:hypothetical protein
MQWLKNKLFTHQYYKITNEGDQVSMMENVPHSYILHIYNDGHLRYHFIKPGKSYKIEYPPKILGLSVTYDNVHYILPTESFVIKHNEFTPTIQKWLCKHYLYIKPHENGQFTMIDQDACIHCCETLFINNINNIK